MAPEFLAVGLVVFVCSVTLFATLRARKPGPPPRRISVIAEPLVAMLALFCGLALEYPALLHHPLLTPLRSLSVLAGTILLFTMLLLLATYLVQSGGRAKFGTFSLLLLLIPVGWGSAFVSRSGLPRRSVSGVTVLLGVDSLSQADDVAELRSMTNHLGGTWYQKPVTPGLLTNTVWPSILMHRLPSETGVVFVYQQVDWSRSPFHLVRRAAAAGCRTVSFFSDQFTTYVGSTGEFDVSRSGPKGWLQLATASVKDASVFLPVALPLLPPIPSAKTPSNQSGTFAFDLRGEIRSILTTSSRPCTFVAGHLSYLHQAQYPRYSELTPAQRSAILGAPVGSLQDRSLDWQFPVIPNDALGLYRWKIQRIQRLIFEEIRIMGFLEPSRKNRLVVFSDHGNRRAVTSENFGKPRYHQVVLATFGVPPRDSSRPISLMDIPEILGFEDESRSGPLEPIVEYTNVMGEEWGELMRSAHLASDGEVVLPPRIVARIASRLRRHRPHTGSDEYLPVPTVAAHPGPRQSH